VLTLAVLLGVPTSGAGEELPSLQQVLGEYARAWGETVSALAADYRVRSTLQGERFSRALGGEWWVLGFTAEGDPLWLRGSLPGPWRAEDAAAAESLAGGFRERLGELLFCGGTTLGGPVVQEDPWTWIVDYPQVAGGVPVEGARLRLRLLRECPLPGGSPGQWCLEVQDDTVVLPAEFDSRPAVAPDGIPGILAEAGYPGEELRGEPRLLVCRPEWDDPVRRLCWEVAGREGTFRVDAHHGRLLGPRTPLLRTIHLRP
jgi:hypothetical protein